MSLKRSLGIVALLSLLAYIASRLFMFFGVKSSTYLIYIMFGYVVAFWNIVLPEDPEKTFQLSGIMEK